MARETFHSASQTAQLSNTSSRQKLFGVELPENDSFEAIATAIADIRTELDAAILKLTSVLNR